MLMYIELYRTYCRTPWTFARLTMKNADHAVLRCVPVGPKNQGRDKDVEPFLLGHDL